MDEILDSLQRKQTLWKVRSNGIFKRTYYVDMHRNCIAFDSSKFACVSGSGGQKVPLSEITEIRSGWQTDNFNRLARSLNKRGVIMKDHPLQECNCFSIIFGDGEFETLDLVANSEQQRNSWVNGLKWIRTGADSPFDSWLMDMFHEADKDGNGTLNFDECCQLLTKIKVEINMEDAYTLFQEANNSTAEEEKDYLELEEFLNFYHSLNGVPKIFQVLFDKYSKGEKELPLDQLLLFLQNEQFLNHLNEQTTERLIQQYERSHLKNQKMMTIDGFSRMLQSPIFNAFNDYHQAKVHQDMEQPLSHYYINSSHNTYLMGDQLTSQSSIEGYISALKKGCKFLEIDLHDGDDNEPKITHGKTLATHIFLRDVLEDAIKPYAFHLSQYPLILSIENHLSFKGQRNMVNLLKEVLGDMLLMDIETSFDHLPSPEQLKNKIIIKAKKPKGKGIEEDSEESNDETDSSQTKSKFKKLKKLKNLTPELKEIVNICEGKKFTDFQTSFQEDKCIHFPALKENKAVSLLKESPEKFVQLTQKQLVKVYPQGTRINSSNMKPYPFWVVGIQVAALNFQKSDDKANFYNECFFRRNGNCGYVLKPDILLSHDLYDPNNFQHNIQETTLRIHVISGQNLVNFKDCDKVNPFVQVKIRGHPLDKQKHKTKTIEGNGLNPKWGDSFEIRIKVSPVCLIYFKVQNDSKLAKDQILGRTAIPFTSLTTGYRTLRLYDTKGKKLSASIFLQIDPIQ